MRPGQQNKRMRGRPNNNRRGPNPLTRSYESNGPDVKIRGNAHHIAEKYLQLARDAHTSGDPVAAENYLQHAEHYFRLIASAQAAQLAAQGRAPGEPDPDDEEDDDGGVLDRFASPAERSPPPPPQGQPQGQPFVPQQPQAGGYYNDRQPYEADRQQQHGERNNFQPRNDRPQQNRQDNRRPPFGERNDNGQRDYRPNQDHRPQREFRNFRDGNPQREPQPAADATPAALPSFITAAPRVAAVESLDAPQPVIETGPVVETTSERPAPIDGASGEPPDDGAQQERGPRGRRRRLRSPYGFQAGDDDRAEPVTPGGAAPTE